MSHPSNSPALPDKPLNFPADMRSLQSHSTSNSRGFTLVEVTVALALFVVAITAVIGVIPFGMDQVKAASNASRAMAEMEGMRDDVGLAISSGMTKSLRYGITPPAVSATTPVDYFISEDGNIAPTSGDAMFRITGNIRRDTATTPVYMSLRATWPARAPAGRESGAVDLFTAFQP